MDESSLREQLESQHSKTWLDRKIKNLKTLSASDRTLMKPVIKKSMRDYYHTQKTLRRIRKAREILERSGPDSAPRMLKELFPGLSPHIERAWQNLSERTYQSGYHTLVFRAPNRADLNEERQVLFILMACEVFQGFEPDPEWLAAWSPHISSAPRDSYLVGWVLASILHGGGKDADTVRSVLVDSINGEHPIGRMSRHAAYALLNSHEPSDWKIMEKLLLAAKRQEGLRQTILEVLDEARPESFRHMLGVILEHNLGRFSSVVRAFDTWLGYAWAGGSGSVVHEDIERICTFYDSDEARLEAIRSGEGEVAYLALWVTALRDIDQALSHAAELIHDKDPGRRYAALVITRASKLLPESLEIPASRLLSGEEDDDRMKVALLSAISSLPLEDVQFAHMDQLFDRVAEIYESWPKKRAKLDPLVWPWDRFERSRELAASALQSVAVDAPNKILPYAQDLSGYECRHFIYQLAGMQRQHMYDGELPPDRKKLEGEAKDFVVRLMGDARQDVYEAAFEVLEFH